MDLEVVSSKLGACPEGGMDLIRAVEKGAPKMGNSVKEHDSKEHDSCHDKSFGDGMGSEMNGGMGMGHGSAGDFLRRFWLVSILLVPLVFTNEAIAGFLNLPTFGLNKWIQFVIATAVFSFSIIFFKHASHEIKMRKYGMMTLVSLAVGAGYLFSVASTFIASLEVEFYLEISTLIWVLLFGHYLEARSGSAAGDALSEVAKLLPKQAHRIVNGSVEEVEISLLSAGDIVLLKPGEKAPADGEIIEGESNVNESLVSGESKPVEKKVGDNVVAGGIVLDGSLTVRLSRVGENSTIGQIQKLIATAKQTKPNSQRIADKASAVLTFVAVITAILTLVIWSVVVGEPFVFAMTLAITVLVIACPHALGLAIPTVTTIATTLAVKNGVFIKNLAKIETIRKADYVVFDKTGTLTKGEFGVTEIKTFHGKTEKDVLQIAATLDYKSSHIIGKTIVAYAKSRLILPKEISDFKYIAGHGSKGKIMGEVYYVGNKALMEKSSVNISDSLAIFGKLAREGKTVIFVSDSKRVIGVIALADEIKDESRRAISRLHTLGVKVAMLSGDSEDVSKGVAGAIGIDTYFAEVLPEDKYKYIRKLQDGGNIVLMVGDGVNDAPALTQSDAGIAIGAGTDVAVEAGDVVLTRSNPEDVVGLVILSKKVYSKMIQNLVWALGYNIVAIPAAAGAFAVWGLYLRPEVGAILMSVSTVIVVANAMLLRRLDLSVT